PGSTPGFGASAKPASPSWASTTSCPSRRRLSLRPRAMARSSSITSTRAMARVYSASTPTSTSYSTPTQEPSPGSRSGSHGQQHAEDRSLALVRLQLDVAAVRFHQPLGDGEAQPGALGVPGEQVVGAIEALEDALEDALAVLLAHALAVVLHLDGDAGPLAARPQD